MRPVCLIMIFFTFYTTLPHNFIKDKLFDLIERTYIHHIHFGKTMHDFFLVFFRSKMCFCPYMQGKESLLSSPYLACNDRNTFALLTLHVTTETHFTSKKN